MGTDISAALIAKPACFMRSKPNVKMMLMVCDMLTTSTSSAVTAAILSSAAGITRTPRIPKTGNPMNRKKKATYMPYLR